MTAHNSFLLCAAELGFVGFFLWMSLIVVTIMQLNRVNNLLEKTNPGMARWARALRLSLGAYLFTSFFLSLTYALPLFMLLGMAGAVIAAGGGDECVPLRGTGWPFRSGALVRCLSCVDLRNAACSRFIAPAASYSRGHLVAPVRNRTPPASCQTTEVGNVRLSVRGG